MTCRLVVLGLVVACGRVDFDPARGDAADTVVESPSCAGLLATCGPSGAEPCCGSLPVPGGTFYRSHDTAADGMYSSMNAPATVRDFALDRYEVTIARFRKFLDAGQGTQANPPARGAGAHPWIPNSGWDPAWNAELAVDTAALVAQLDCEPPYHTWTDAPGPNDNAPMTCISWFEAFAFCAWDGGFMPTEAEWNYAAAGGSEQRAYPWSSPPNALVLDCSYANHLDVNGYCPPPDGRARRVGSLSPRGDGRWGHADLAGNAWEWTLDGNLGGYTNPCTDCVELNEGTGRVVRGGGFRDPSSNLRASRRIDVAHLYRGGGLDVRCAR